MRCYLARHGIAERGDIGPCHGALIRAHLIPRQVLKREGHPEAIDDPRSWVPACGGLTGSAGHHGAFDYARTIRLSWESLPVGTIELADELGLRWYLDRTYPKTNTNPGGTP